MTWHHAFLRAPRWGCPSGTSTPSFPAPSDASSDHAYETTTTTHPPPPSPSLCQLTSYLWPTLLPQQQPPASE
eukprot:4880074-Pyramimonas_sp.AAC.1